MFGNQRSLLASVLGIAIVSAACAPAAPSVASPAPTAAATAAAATATAAPTPRFSAAVQKLIDAAKAEGELSMVVHDTLFDARRGVTAFARAFNSYFGLDLRVKVETAPGASGTPQTSQVIQEVQAGRVPSTDVYFGPDNQLGSLIRAKAAQAVDWRALDPRIPELAVSEGALAYATRISGITYATNFVKAGDVPKTMQQVLDAKWKGKVASTPFVAGFSSLSRSTEWGPDRTVAYVTELKKLTGGLIQCNAWDRFSSGEFHLLVMNCGHYEVLQAKREGKPVEFALVSDALRVSYQGLAIPKGSAHPNAATLLGLFLISEEGQKISYEQDFFDLHLLASSKNRAAMKTHLDQGSKILGEDGLVNGLKYAAEQQENKVVDRIRNILTSP